MKEKYRTILFHYLEQGGERDLELAYELGRQALDQGISLLDLMDEHYAAMREVSDRAGNIDESKMATRASNLLKEALAPFEMAQRGFRQTIQSLCSQNEELKQVIEQRSQLLQQREDFMMVLAHDLKTPITAADRCLDLMLAGDFGQMNPGQEQIISTMKDSNQRMFAMIKNLLEIYKYDQATPALCLNIMDVGTAIDVVAGNFASSAQMRGLTLTEDVSSEQHMVLADGIAIQHVLTNLVDNAMKFTARGGSITMAAHSEGNQVIVEVKDTGKGINQEDMPRLFQRFFQSAAGRKQYTGTGLGLYLCRQIVKAHGGDIRCESHLGVGSTFIITLPRHS